MILGFTPAFSLQTVLVFILLFLFRIQIGAAFLSAFFFKFGAYLLDPLFDVIGKWALQLDGAKDVYTTLFNMPIVPYTRFNNSIVMGSAILSVLLVPFVFVISQIMIVKYRKTVVERFRDTKLWKAVQATYFYKWYAKYDELFG